MDTSERRIAGIAARQDNIITRAQLRQAGMTERQLDWRVERGDLRRLHRGIYLTGYAPPSSRAAARAAVLACGPDALASHRSATALWGLTAAPARPEVTVIARNPGPKPGITIHRVTAVPAEERRGLGGLPVASPVRAVIDFAAHATRGELEHVIQEAIVKRILSDEDLQAGVERGRCRPGVALVRSVLALESGPGFTRSAAERALISIVNRAGLPSPEKNVVICGQRVDAAWRDQRLVVEADGRGPHDHGLAFERDRRRDQILISAGWRVIRVTYRQLHDEPERVAAVIAAALVR